MSFLNEKEVAEPQQVQVESSPVPSPVPDQQELPLAIVGNIAPAVIVEPPQIDGLQ